MPRRPVAAVLLALPLLLGLATTAEAVTPTVSVRPSSVVEGGSGTRSATFAVRLSVRVRRTVSVTARTYDRSATAGSDYVARVVTVSVPAGSWGSSVTVPVYGDTTPEPDETFAVTLSRPVNATLGTATALGTVLDDDSDPVVVAAGDIGCETADPLYNGGDGTATACHQRATSDLAVAARPNAVLTLGDDQYESGALGDYQDVYAPTWGRLRSITKPVPGNHDYSTADAVGYFGYFGSAAGDPSRGYYSYDLGSWHLVALNSNCGEVGGCYYDDPQGQWLTADLQAHPNACVLAYWHQPRFSSGAEADDVTGALYRTLVTYGADVLLTAHDHLYERFAPQDGDAVATASGVREFVVGTGGKSLFPVTHAQANSQVVNNTTFGVLVLTLHPASYEWRFVGEPGATFTDSGTASCHS